MMTQIVMIILVQSSDINSVEVESDYSNSERNDYESTSHDQFSLFI